MSSSTVMPWGKHKGQLIVELPSSYLRWLAENCNDETICQAADEEYRYRDDHNDHNDHWGE